jgi:hypothetical protein
MDAFIWTAWTFLKHLHLLPVSAAVATAKDSKEETYVASNSLQIFLIILYFRRYCAVKFPIITMKLLIETRDQKNHAVLSRY